MATWAGWAIYCNQCLAVGSHVRAGVKVSEIRTHAKSCEARVLNDHRKRVRARGLGLSRPSISQVICRSISQCITRSDVGGSATWSSVPLLRDHTYRTESERDADLKIIESPNDRNRETHRTRLDCLKCCAHPRGKITLTNFSQIKRRALIF